MVYYAVQKVEPERLERVLNRRAEAGFALVRSWGVENGTKMLLIFARDFATAEERAAYVAEREAELDRADAEREAARLARAAARTAPAGGPPSGDPASAGPDARPAPPPRPGGPSRPSAGDRGAPGDGPRRVLSGHGDQRRKP